MAKEKENLDPTAESRARSLAITIIRSKESARRDHRWATPTLRRSAHLNRSVSLDLALGIGGCRAPDH